MAPGVTMDFDDDFIQPAGKTTAQPLRTLLLAPPSIASHEEKLREVLSAHDRSTTDLQMLDRLSAGLVTLPSSTFDLILILTDADGSRTESSQLLGRNIFSKIVDALKAGGKIQSQDGTFGQSDAERTEAILSGLVAQADGMSKPDYSASEAVPLNFRKKKSETSNAGPPVVPIVNAKRKSADVSKDNKPVGVGFVDFSDDFGEPIITGEDDDDDEYIDEDTLLTEDDLKRPVVVPPECAPRVGKRRRACKDCTCGLAEKLAKEDAAARSNAEVQLKTLKLDADDLAEVDFTVQGKVGSCGNCSLGDAFRCAGCPFLGLPAMSNFKVGDEVRLLNNDIQL